MRKNFHLPVSRANIDGSASFEKRAARPRILAFVRSSSAFAASACDRGTLARVVQVRELGHALVIANFQASLNRRKLPLCRIKGIGSLRARARANTTADDVNTRDSGTTGADEFNFPLVTRGMKNDDFIDNVTPPPGLSTRRHRAEFHGVFSRPKGGG